MEFDPKQKSRRATDALRAVLSGLTKQVVHDVPDYVSDHYRPSQHDVEDTRTGFDGDGDYHHPMLFVGLDSPQEPSLYQRWLDHTSDWRKVELDRIADDRGVPRLPTLPDVTVVRDPRFDVDI